MENISIISIEGNIGSGKSTLLRKIQYWAKENSYSHIYFALEPVDDWNKIRDNNGETILSKFYKDQKKYAFPFQMMAFITRYNKIQELIDEITENQKKSNVFGLMEKSIIITERCLYTDKYVFAKMLYDDDKIDEVNYQIYNSWFETFAKKIPISEVIYINTPYTICDERIKNRNRAGESSIPMDYLTRCEGYHNLMIQTMVHEKKTKIIQINGEEDINNIHVLNKWLETIKNSLIDIDMDFDY
jgi:deoxyadenosine/deoxycytidine kinase